MVFYRVNSFRGQDLAVGIDTEQTERCYWIVVGHEVTRCSIIGGERNVHNTKYLNLIWI